MDKRSNSDTVGLSNQFVEIVIIIYSSIILLKVKKIYFILKKMIFSFCLWRLHLEFKLSSINKFVNKNNLKDNDEIEKAREGRISKDPRDTMLNIHLKVKTNSILPNKDITIMIDD